MVNTTLNLIVSLDVGDEVPEREFYNLTTQVLKSIARSGVDSVKRPESGEDVVGHKGPLIDLNTLFITLTSAGVLTAVIQLLKEWVLRAEGRKVVIKAQSKDKSIEFEYTPTAVSEEELMDFAEKTMQMLEKPDLFRGS